MRVANHVKVLGLIVVAMLIAGSAVAAEVTEPEATQPEVTAPEAADVARSETEPADMPALEGEKDVVYQNDTGNEQKGITCSCECTCVPTGVFEVQTFDLPEWTHRSCPSFNGDACTPSTPDTCPSPRRYLNCVQI